MTFIPRTTEQMRSDGKDALTVKYSPSIFPLPFRQLQWVPKKKPEPTPLAVFMHELIKRAKDRHAETLRDFGADPAEVFGARETEPIIAWEPVPPGEIRFTIKDVFPDFELTEKGQWIITEAT